LDCSYLLTKYLACHLQGLIALLTGRQDDAVAILEEAAKLEIQLPVAHIGGSARLLQARLLMDQNNSENAFAVADPVISDWMIASTPGYVLLDGPVIKPVLRMLARRKRTGAGIMLHLFAKDLHGMDESDSIQASGPASAAPLSEPLTPREREVLKLLVAGRTNLQISAELFISKETVKSHVAHLMRKLDVNSRVQASIRARELGF
jgi:DNA-binding CsgD family transcriptional regulator